MKTNKTKKQFLIHKSSCWDKNIQPIKEAKKVSIQDWDIRDCNETYFNERKLGGMFKWREKGKNHIEINKNKIARAFDSFDWEVEINNLDDLFKLESKYGQLIISKHQNDFFSKDAEIYEIEIYDSYRE